MDDIFEAEAKEQVDVTLGRFPDFAYFSSIANENDEM